MHVSSNSFHRISISSLRNLCTSNKATNQSILSPTPIQYFKLDEYIQISSKRKDSGEGLWHHSPCIFLDLTEKWSAHRHWTRDNLLKKYGDKWFQCGWNHKKNEPIIIKYREFDQMLENTEQSPYIFDPTFEYDCPELLSDYSVPSIFAERDKFKYLPIDQQPDDMNWFLVGGQGSGSVLHVDPVQSSAWNALVTGLKEWYIFPPIDNNPTTYSSDVSINDHFQIQIPQYLHDQYARDTRSEVKLKEGYFHFTQKPGEIVYVPCGWRHAVRNLSFSVAITHNFLESP